MASSDRPWILGLSASHNGAACLLHGEKIVAAVQEERLVGQKRARLSCARHSLAIEYCLEQGGINASQLDMVVLCPQTELTSPENDIGKSTQLGVALHNTPVISLSHHAGHAISAFCTSGFDESAALVVDGMGSPSYDLGDNEKDALLRPGVIGGETNSIYRCNTGSIEALEKHMIADGRWLTPPPVGAAMQGFGSLGGMFSAVAGQIFGNTMDAGKVMGLAPYGKANIGPAEFFEIRDGEFVFNDTVPKRFGSSERWPANQEHYQDLSASVQNALEHALLYLVGRVRDLCSSRNLVYAGGVALNSVANERIIRESDFEQVYIVPAAEDSGPAIGAAYYGLWKLTGRFHSSAMEKDGLGKTYSEKDIDEAISRTPALVSISTGDSVDEAAELLAQGKIIGWFNGPSELGPRSLGQRSILCDPRLPDAKEKLNARVKHREAFRPFAPVLPLEEVSNWFELGQSTPVSPFMLRIMRFRDDRLQQVPGVVHVDNTGRVQTVTEQANGDYYRLVKAFGKLTGVPMLINTSLNVMGEPIVETPEDALWCLLLTQLDACVFEGRVVTRKPGYNSFHELYPYFLVGPEDIRRTPDGQGLLFSASTPWGRYPFALREGPIIAIMELLLGGLANGANDTAHIFDTIRSQLGNMPDAMLVRLFAQLRRWRLISFREKPVAAKPLMQKPPATGRAPAPADSTPHHAAVDEGLRLLTGQGTQANPSRGLAIIEEAAKTDARAAYLAATVFGASFWQQQDWEKALDYLQHSAELGHQQAAESLVLLAAGPAGNLQQSQDWRSLRASIDLRHWFEAPACVELLQDPETRVIENFIPASTCDWLIEQGKNRLSRATIYDQVTGGTTRDQRRTNSQCDLGLEHCGLLTFVLRARISAITGRPDRAMEIPKLLHYTPGETFARHFDYLDPQNPAYAQELTSRGQRVQTFLVYLNDDYDGGETSFPLLEFAHRGKKGSAFMFSNVDNQGKPHELTMHVGEPPTKGEKWVFSQWIRSFPAG